MSVRRSIHFCRCPARPISDRSSSDWPSSIHLSASPVNSLTSTSELTSLWTFNGGKHPSKCLFAGQFTDHDIRMAFPPRRPANPNDQPTQKPVHADTKKPDLNQVGLYDLCQMMDSNQRRQCRRIYNPLPLAARAIWRTSSENSLNYFKEPFVRCAWNVTHTDTKVTNQQVNA